MIDANVENLSDPIERNKIWTNKNTKKGKKNLLLVSIVSPSDRSLQRSIVMHVGDSDKQHIYIYTC